MGKKKTVKKKILSRDEKMLEMIREVQMLRPGWRFMLIGGDTQYDYIRDRKGIPIEVNTAKAVKQGWQAEFFGEMNPRENFGDRHAQSGWYADMFDAVLIACAQAKKKINADKPKDSP